MKIKKIRKIFLGLFFAVIPFTLSSCSATTSVMNNISIWEKYNTLGSYINENYSDGLKWISQRTFSLRMRINPETEGESDKFEFGTAWIYAKDSSSSFTYYLATNIHVISNLNSLNSDVKRYQETDWGGSKKLENYNFVNLSFNFVSDDHVSSLLKKPNGDINYLYEYPTPKNYDDPYITLFSENHAIQKPEIVYTATGNNLLKNTTNKNDYINPYTKKIIENPAIDFAIIKVDFSSVLDEKNQNGTTVKQFLETYDSNPTTFSSNSTIDYNSTFYLAGFPEEYQIWKPNLNVAWLGLDEIRLNSNNNFISLNYESQISKYASFDNPQGPMPLASSISYVKQETKDYLFLWYRNVANQLIIGGGSLGGGASGSMLVSEKDNKFYVVGIYWGAYEFTTRNGIDYAYGGVDLIKTNPYYIDVDNRGITMRYNFPGYDVTKAAGIAVKEI
ncbi:MAG: DUF31 family protein [Malacoplasma sp.]|nr:DUF31 family protein [Malacoplasma sp.]MDE5775211.1 DUF31 family protein [Malacoplasma sp.]